MMVKRSRDVLTILWIPAFTLSLLPAELRGEDRRITVTGHSQIDVKPDTFEITIPISANGTLASQALQSFRDAKKKTLHAIQALKVEGLSVTSSGTAIGGSINTASNGMVVNNGIVFNTTPAAAGSARMNNTFHENLVIRVANIDRMTEDQIQDLYAKLSEDVKKSKDIPPLNFSVVFRLQNSSSAKELALEKAIADARSKATQLARLLGVKIGKVIHAREQESASELSTRNTPVQRIVRGRQAVLSAIEPKLTVASSVLVEFEIID